MIISKKNFVWSGPFLPVFSIRKARGFFLISLFIIYRKNKWFYSCFSLFRNTESKTIGSPFAEQNWLTCETMWKKNVQNGFSKSVYTNFNGKVRMTSPHCIFWAKSRFEKRKKTSRTATFREVSARTKRRRISLYIMKREIGCFLHCFTAKNSVVKTLFAGFWNVKILPKRTVENESKETEELGNKNRDLK